MKQKIITGLRSVYSGRKVAKRHSETLIIEYSNILTDAQEEAGKVTPSTHVNNMQRREECHTLARRIKYIKGKFSKTGTTLVTQQKKMVGH